MAGPLGSVGRVEGESMQRWVVTVLFFSVDKSPQVSSLTRGKENLAARREGAEGIGAVCHGQRQARRRRARDRRARSRRVERRHRGENQEGEDVIADVIERVEMGKERGRHMGLGSREAEHTRDGRVFFFRERSEQTRSVRELGRGDELGRSNIEKKSLPPSQRFVQFKSRSIVFSRLNEPWGFS